MRLITFKDFVTANPPVIDWRVKGVFPTEGVNFIAGIPGLGKSWLGMDLGVSGVTGTPWMNFYETSPCPVLYVDVENSPRLMSSRFNKLVRARQIDPETITNFHFGRPEMMLLDTPQGLRLAANALQESRAKIMVLDSLTRFHAGDENTVKDMAKVSRSLLYLVNTFHCCIVIIDHLGKHSADLRGSTEKQALPETVLSVSPFGEKVMKVSVTKLRATGEKPDPFLVELKDLSPDATLVRVASDNENGDCDLERDTEMDWMRDFIKGKGGSIPRPELEKEAKTRQGWGQKKVSNLLTRGLGKDWHWFPRINPATNHAHYIVELLEVGKTPTMI